MQKNKSELRQDLVSGDWIVISPGRSKRPEQLIKKPKKRKIISKRGCPFENSLENDGQKPILIYGSGKKWEVWVVENKFPAFVCMGRCSVFSKTGPYLRGEAVGHHELVITRDHYKNFAALSHGKAQQVLETFRDRYLALLNDKCISYVSIFHNWGPKAGASIFHPHYQIAAIPVVPPDVNHSLEGSSRYFKKYKKCVHCVMMDYEIKNKKRILYENKGAVAFTPYVSKEPFEVRIFPKKHSPYFENAMDADLDSITDALQFTLRKIKKNLKDPDYNFFFHTASIKNKENYKHYHWHIEVIPKLHIAAGFELSTGMEINAADPDEAAKLLRE